MNCIGASYSASADGTWQVVAIPSMPQRFDGARRHRVPHGSVGIGTVLDRSSSPDGHHCQPHSSFAGI